MPLTSLAGGLVGSLLADRYQVEATLGRGAMGEVYRARHVMMGRTCAIKVMNPAVSRDPEAIGRFNREATNASRINHPNVCAVYDFGLTADGSLYLAMEYVEGTTLGAILRTGPIADERVGSIVAQCAAGLEAAHEIGIVHRDLKPDNIMVVDQRGREIVKVVDFGIAKTAGEGDQRVTRTGLVVGTPEYMSPEQLSGDPIDGRSDQYSLALVTYRMLTGDLPFPARSVQEAITRRLTEPPRRLADSGVSRRFPEPLEAALRRALERRPANRYPTVTAFAEAVAAAISEPARAAARPLAPTRVVPRPKRGRGRGRAAAIAAGSAIALAAIGFLAWSARERPAVTAGLPADSMTVRAPDSARPDSAVASPPPAEGADRALPPPPPAVTAEARAAATPDTDAAGAEPAIPVIEDFDRPTSPRARRAAAAALRLSQDHRVDARIRAEMAWLVGQHLLDLGRRADAARAFRRSCRIHPTAPCGPMLRQLEDVP